MLCHLDDEFSSQGLISIFPNMTFAACGVDIFFVISGFIIVYSTQYDRNSLNFGSFMLRRLIRIAPLYWIFTSIFTLLILHAGRHSHLSTDVIWQIIASYLFIPAVDPGSGDVFPIYSLGWTLNFEMFFYITFAAASGLPRRFAPAVLPILFVALYLAGAVLDLPFPLSYWAGSQILEFLFGMLIAGALIKGCRMNWKMAVPIVPLALVAIQLFVPFIDSASALRGWAWGIPAAAIVACAALIPSLAKGGSMMRLLESLGDMSYSLYIVHYAVFVGIESLLSVPLSHHAIPASIYAALLLLASLIAAFSLHRLVERPLTYRLHQIAFGRPAVDRKPVVSGSVAICRFVA